MAKVLISYRRDDSVAYAGRLYDHLSRHLGADNVFIDMATIKPGQDFAAVIEQSVNSCDVLIALIGKGWLASAASRPGRRIDQPDDFVRKEIALALARPIPVIPVLVGGATMPRSEELPDDLAEFGRRQAVELTDARFARDVEHLVLVLADTNDVLASTAPVRVDARHPYRPWLGAAAAVVVVGAALTYWQFREPPPSVTAPLSQTLSPAVKPAPDNRPVAPPATDPTDRADASASGPPAGDSSRSSPGPARSAATRRTPEQARTQLAQWAVPYTSEAFLERVQRGDLAAVQLFLEAGMDPDVVGSVPGASSVSLYERHNALMTAADEGYVEIVKALIAAGADVTKGSSRYTPLYLAARARHREVVNLLLAAGVSVADLNEAFVPAAATGQLDLLRELARRGADVKQASTDALSQILNGSVVNREGESDAELVEPVKVLLSMGADPNSRDSGWTPLMKAASNGHPGPLRLLLAAGADVNARCACPNTGYGGSTPLMLAAREGHVECVEALLQRPHDLSLTDDAGRTALQRAERPGLGGEGERQARLVALIKAAMAR